MYVKIRIKVDEGIIDLFGIHSLNGCCLPKYYQNIKIKCKKEFLNFQNIKKKLRQSLEK